MPPADSPQSPRRIIRFRRRLRSRIILSFVLLGFGLTVLFAFAAVWASKYVENQLVDDVMTRNIDEFMRLRQENPDAKPTFAVDQLYGRVVNPKDPGAIERLAADYPEWVNAPEGISSYHGTDRDNNLLAYKVAVRRTPDAWYFLAYDTRRANLAQDRLVLWLAFSVTVFVILSFVIGWWSASKVMSPVSDLAARLRAYRGSSEPQPLAPHFPEDEVGQLAQALDDYSDRLTDVVQRDREFNADVSHELRTPLAVIRGSVELMLSRPDLDEKTKARLQRIQRAEQQGTDLISALLLLSRSERGHGNTDVARVVEQLLESHRAQLGSKDLLLRMEGEGGRIIDAPEAALSVALGNLIGNAVKYTKQGEVVVRLLADGVEVIDSGPGLSAEDAARLFERGYRGSHAGHSQGGGIGLSIVSRLCALYGWQVNVRPGELTGVIATLSFLPRTDLETDSTS